jgi:hypothetical protein
MIPFRSIAGNGMAPSAKTLPEPLTLDKGERRRGKQLKRVCWTKRSYNGSGQERRSGGKFVCAPWLSKLLNNIGFLAESADSAVGPALFIDGKFTRGETR